MEKDMYRDITVTSKGQITLPVRIRRALKLNSRRKLRVALTKEGIVTLSPLPDIMQYYGILKSKIPYDPDEKRKAWEALAKDVMRRDKRGKKK